MKFKWTKDEGGGYALISKTYIGYVENAGRDIFGTGIVDAMLIRKADNEQLSVGSSGCSFPGVAAAKKAVERAITLDMAGIESCNY